MTFRQYSNNYEYQLTSDKNVSNGKTKKYAIIENLKLSVTFRDNILYIFSYLLYGRENNLTEEQYTSLETLYEFLKKKMVYMYNLLPILLTLDIADKNQQTSIVLSSLIKNLPPYIRCTAKYLATEIEWYRIDLNTLLKPTKSETFDYLTDIDLNTLSPSKIRNEEMIGYDENSNITQKALGPVFVKLIYNLQRRKLSLSQELFGLILINLPNFSDDPVLEENVRYLYDLTRNNIIDSNDWDSIGKNPVGNDAYTLVFSVLTKILNSNIQMVIKDSASYIYHHLKIPTVPTYLDSNLKYMHHLLEKDIDIGMLLSAVIPQEFDEDTIRMKDRLLTYFVRNYRKEDMTKTLKGFNKFAYNNPLDLLLAFLVRLINRVPSSPNTNSVQQPASALLSAVFMKKYSRIFTPFVSPEIDVLILLESVQVSDVDQILQSTVDSIKLELISQPTLSVLLSTLIPTEKEKCEVPKQCLVNTFQQIPKLQNNISLNLTTKIQNVAYILKTIPQPQQIRESHVAQYSIKPVNVNLYLDRDQDRENSIAMAIKTDNMYRNNVPSGGINGVSYVWNIDKYVDKTGPAGQNELQVKTVEWETGIPTEIDSTESKMVSPTIDQVHITETKVTKPKVSQPKVIIQPKVTQPKFTQTHVTEHDHTQERLSDLIDTIPLTSKPLTTFMSDVPSLGTYYPTKKPQKKQPRYTTFTPIERVVDDSNPKVEEYIYIPSKVNYDEKESPSKESEDQTSSSEEIIKEVTTKKPTKTKLIQHTKSPLLNSIERKVHSENVVSSAIVLPPSIEIDQPLKVHLFDNNVPVVTTSDDYNTTKPEVVLPDIKELLKSPDIDKLMQNSDSPIVTQVLQPLSIIFGKNYIKKILKNMDMKHYPTNIALLSAILKEALTYPEVTQNSQLTNVINQYIVTIEYVSPTTLLPVVVSSKKLVSDVIYSTFNPNDLTQGKISENLPDESLPDSITVPLINPKILLESVNPSNPYVDLLPTLEKGNIFAKTIQPIKMIFTIEKIKEILGPDFQPLVYPNKITLLITLLRKLQKSKIIQANAKLKSAIDSYLQAFEQPSISMQVSEDSFVYMKSDTTGQWLPELTSLISALPTPETEIETTMIEEIEQYLDDPTLWEKLKIAKPPVTMSRGELLHEIIRILLSGTISIDNSILKAFRYYKDKVEFIDMGALPIVWMWVEMYVFKAEVQLGDMIQETVNFDQLSYKEKLAYNDIITYLAQNSNLLQNNEDFDFEKYKTQGQFVKGLFTYLLKKLEVNKKIKKDIKMILPHVTETGAGAIAMPNLSGF
ncbi:hypothetical protein ALC56_02617 [Trachymyrmex septentrionalis]|uniref:Uncharacterized protein n=1 Tax=Trachymyrmex septentrionalis TaxID=34720 RepID=A0A195FQE8_9HYME|nr:hypothetical protein ALC56_02617 [Trachymyrmex septentrionalis]